MPDPRHVKASRLHLSLKSSRTFVLRDTVYVTPYNAALIDLSSPPDVVYPGAHL